MAEQTPLDPETHRVLENILKKEPSELNANDRGILRARWSYMGLFMGKRSQQRYLDVLNQEEPAVETPKEEEQPDNRHPAEQTQPDDDGDDE